MGQPRSARRYHLLLVAHAVIGKAAQFAPVHLTVAELDDSPAATMHPYGLSAPALMEPWPGVTTQAALLVHFKPG